MAKGNSAIFPNDIALEASIFAVRCSGESHDDVCRGDLAVFARELSAVIQSSIAFAVWFMKANEGFVLRIGCRLEACSDHSSFMGRLTENKHLGTLGNEKKIIE